MKRTGRMAHSSARILASAALAVWGAGCASQRPRTVVAPAAHGAGRDAAGDAPSAVPAPAASLAAGVTCGTNALVAASPVEFDWDAGFLASGGTDAYGNRRARALGPIFESRVAPDGKRFLAVRPFYCREDGPDDSRTIHEYLWPVASLKDFKQERFWRFLLVYGHDFDRFTTGSRYRFSALPLVFAGRNAAGEPYFALFPVGGKIYDFLTRDKIVFALFPLYSYSTINDLKTHSVLWPLGSYTRGEGVLRYRVVPFYGRSKYKDRWTKSFVLWPVWTGVEYSYPNSKGSGHVLFPLYGHVKLTDQETWMFLPPFFRWTQGEQADKIHAPWPLFQSASGVSDRLVIWPLWGTKKQGATESWFLFWPIVWSNLSGDPTNRVRNFRVMPFVHYRSRVERENSTEAASTEAVTERYWRFWPLVSYNRDGSNAVVRTLALWPFKRGPQVERNFAPFWTLYSRERTGGEVWHEALWGLYRQGRDAEGLRHWSLFPLATVRQAPEREERSVSCLLGLFRYERKGMDRRWRLLYFLRWGGTPPQSEADAARRDSRPPEGNGVL